jgi:hypothetical protein
MCSFFIAGIEKFDRSIETEVISKTDEEFSFFVYVSGKT